MQKLMQPRRRESSTQRSVKQCAHCGHALCAKDMAISTALVCLEESCVNNWTRDGAEIILMLR